MGLGILEDKYMEHVPGTTRYFDDPERPQYAVNGSHARGLKCDTSGPVPIILVPQPSDDPNDPLNWPLWRRDLITFILSITAVFATALGPILAANTITLLIAFSRPFEKIAELTGWYLLGVGLAGFLFVPSGRIWGKRHLFVFSTLLLVVTSAWGGASNTKDLYQSMVAARVFQGIATAPFEAFVNAAVGDLYFVHERGKRMAFSNLAVFGGAFFTPILVGKITATIGWPWTFYFISIFCAAAFPAIFFFCPETAYRRDASLNIDMLGTANHAAATHADHDPPPSYHHGSSDINSTENPTASTRGQDKQHANDLEKVGSTSQPAGTDPESNGHTGGEAPAPGGVSGVDDGRAADASMAAPRTKMTYRQSLALFNGRKTDESFWKLLLRPLPLFIQPAFLWACLIQGLLIGWTVFIGVIMAQFFFGRPLWWDEVQTGYAYTAAFVGAIIGFVIAGTLADWSARVLTRWNGGVYEPEFRIFLVIPQMVFGCAGLYGFGITVDGLLDEKNGYLVPMAFFALEVAGMVIGAVASSLYIVDAYRDLAIEGFTCMIIFKNVFSFALTFKAFDWLIENHTEATPLFNALASVQLVVCLLSIPIYVFGKQLRGYFYRHDLLALCGLR